MDSQNQRRRVQTILTLLILFSLFWVFSMNDIAAIRQRSGSHGLILPVPNVMRVICPSRHSAYLVVEWRGSIWWCMRAGWGRPRRP